jgi:hypothetical protein
MADGSWRARRILMTRDAGLSASHIADFLTQERHTLGYQDLIVLDDFVRCPGVWMPIGLINHS